MLVEVALSGSGSSMNNHFLEEISSDVQPALEVIVGLTDLLLDMQLPAEQRAYVEAIQRSGHELAHTLHALLDFSRLQSGDLAPESNPFNLRVEIEETLEHYAAEGRERRTELAYYLATNGAEVFLADGQRIRQILTHLIGDAVNRTIGGEIFLEGYRYNEGDRCLIYLSVHDNGMALSSELLQELNTSRSRRSLLEAAQTYAAQFPLFISRALVNFLGGDIWFESSPTHGTIVTLTIGVEVDQLVPARPPHDCLSVFEDKLVLVIDNSVTGREVLKRQLEAWCLRPIMAESASVALHLLQPGSRFDLILIDEHLDDMDGITLAAAIRHREELDGVPLILLGKLRDIDTRYSRYFTTSVDKPFRAHQLYERLRVTLRDSSTKNFR